MDIQFFDAFFFSLYSVLSCSAGVWGRSTPCRPTILSIRMFCVTREIYFQSLHCSPCPGKPLFGSRLLEKRTYDWYFDVCLKSANLRHKKTPDHSDGNRSPGFHHYVGLLSHEFSDFENYCAESPAGTLSV